MTSATQWSELTTQQLVRYEALFTLLDEIKLLDDIAEIARRVAVRWKYFANVTNWRLVLAKEEEFLVIDGFRGEARITETQTLASWDDLHWKQCLPSMVPGSAALEDRERPEHLAGKSVTEIEVLPFMHMGRCFALLSVAARHVPFSELDKKFILLFGGYFADRIADILLRRQVMSTLVARATRDTLTGLLNRGAIIERLGSQLALSRRTGQALSLILADVDRFKDINDNHGHLVGDAVLRELGRRLRDQARDSDSLGRFGGEEFLFVLYPCTEEELAQAAERFRRAIADTPFSLGGEPARDIAVTISLGTICSAGQDEAGMEDLLRQADVALYQSKAAGRNRVTAAQL